MEQNQRALKQLQLFRPRRGSGKPVPTADAEEVDGAKRVMRLGRVATIKGMPGLRRTFSLSGRCASSTPAKALAGAAATESGTDGEPPVPPLGKQRKFAQRDHLI